MLRLVPVALLAALPDSALACGGFFCETATPVEQSAERIVFAIDQNAGTIDAHVQISYEGPAEDFAWIVPTPGEPEVFLSSEALFDTLAANTRPAFDVDMWDLGDCQDPIDDVDLGYDAPSAQSGSDDLQVVGEGEVGPYETTVLQASSEDALIAWLQDHDYDVPNQMSEVLAPYVAQGQHFVALRLGKDQDAGDLMPIGLTYSGSQPVVPIQLTSVAATPDMSLEVYVFAEHRAVPANYLHVRINPAAVDWLATDPNYRTVVGRAADEAGSQAFATDFSGSPESMRGTLYSPLRYDPWAFAALTHADQVMVEVQRQGIPANKNLRQVLREHIPEDYLSCPTCWTDLVAPSVDGMALASDIEERIFAPLRRAEALFHDHAKLTRMSSSLSPAEMTVDPRFVVNASMNDVNTQRTAMMTTDCRGGLTRYTAPRTLQLPGGEIIGVPSPEWFDTTGTSTADFFADSASTNAGVIERTGSQGAPEVLQDNTLDNRGPRSCASSPGPVSGWLAIGAMALLRRRRSTGRCGTLPPNVRAR